MGTRSGRAVVGLAVLAAVLVSRLVAAGAWEEPRVTARAALVMDAGSGEILYARNPGAELPPASTTKVMTAILALESGRLSEQVVASSEACRAAPSKIYLRPGQRLELEELLYAILLNSANDASVAVAEHLAGSVPAFGARMSARARQLGALDTRLVNPHGLTADGHYTTARDLAIIFRHALGLPRFREILSTKSTVIDVEKSSRRITLRSHNKLLDAYRIPVIGKTGYTIPAKKCFVGAGAYGDREIIVAVLGSSDLWGDTRRLLEFGFGGDLPAVPAVRHARRPSSPTALARGRAATRQAARRGPTAAERARGAPVRGPSYAVTVGTFTERERAQRLQRALGRRGYEAAVARVASGRGKSRRMEYRVQVGPYANRAQAQSAVRSMAGQVDLDARIVRR